MDILYLAQQQTTPLGPEFGKASPIGLLIIVALAFIVIYLGWAFARRQKRLARRQAFAEARGLNVFDEKLIDEAMAAEGLLGKDKKHLI
ncbi:hypothetical protein [Corynebacterium epidermidicanis]|uniref:Uncharacterized protein n=1 Tax=Corynebacterium epidermidicanis TaxID=1050174 RepID=A0A0G3GT94_9CORY|nr:hypothetical protein [Corynebacterium epidermidicanis]AKK02748.1 hypothetical protein CEPID_04385 [Corynebacterium epidermidicanis]